ncbi:MAG TPA: tandem-95 repeat protein [Acidimicrobiales bacterium]|nr:tandem-95 repeat protein [Acidimicrobiales bacterium]
MRSGAMRRAGALGAVLVLAAALLAMPSSAAPVPTVSNVQVTTTPNLANHLARYTVTFRTSPTGALMTGNTITLRFPSGTVPGSSCGAVADFANNVTINGVLTSVSSIVTCIEVRVAVPAAIGNSTNVTVVLGSTTPVVRNPGAGNYALKLHTTKDFGDANSQRYRIVAQHAPVATGQTASTNEDVAATLTLAGSDADGDPLTFSVVTGSGPSHGALGPIGTPACSGGTPNACSAAVTYTPTGNYNGPDSFQFRVRDGIVNSGAATVSLTVVAVNDGPDAVDDDVTVEQDSGANALAVLANDSDADGDTLTIVATAGGANGTVTITGGGTGVSYTPNAGFNGFDSFSYTVNDGHGATDTATVHVEVAAPGGGGGGGSFTAEICAKPGTVTMPDGAVVDIWGFALGDCDVAGPATLPGPLLDVTVGDQVTLTLDNSLGENVSLAFVGQNAFPDPTGAAPGTEKTYTFTAAQPGTFLYESGDNRQVLMGLHGALLVRPTTAGQAYNTAASAYDVEAVLVLSEIDPAFNADPAGFDLTGFRPRYWLINGAAYPGTAPIPAPPGSRVLLRYLDAGTVHHTMALLGSHQRAIAKDAYPVRYPFDVVGETIPVGSTLDTIVTVPAGAAAGTRFWLYNRQLHLDNAGAFPGGMVTFIEVSGP